MDLLRSDTSCIRVFFLALSVCTVTFNLSFFFLRCCCFSFSSCSRICSWTCCGERSSFSFLFRFCLDLGGCEVCDECHTNGEDPFDESSPSAPEEDGSDGLVLGGGEGVLAFFRGGEDSRDLMLEVFEGEVVTDKAAPVAAETNSDKLLPPELEATVSYPEIPMFAMNKDPEAAPGVWAELEEVTSIWEESLDEAK